MASPSSSALKGEEMSGVLESRSALRRRPWAWPFGACVGRGWEEMGSAVFSWDVGGAEDWA